MTATPMTRSEVCYRDEASITVNSIQGCHGCDQRNCAAIELEMTGDKNIVISHHVITKRNQVVFPFPTVEE